jgi:hypothetical protein
MSSSWKSSFSTIRAQKPLQLREQPDGGLQAVRAASTITAL